MLVPWKKENSIIRFTVTSNGLTGSEWIAWFADHGYVIHEDVKKVLNSTEFQSTTGLSYNVAMLTGELYADCDRHTLHVYRDAVFKRKLFGAPIELACLVRQALTTEEIRRMGLVRVCIMHELVVIHANGERAFLTVDGSLGGEPELNVVIECPGLPVGQREGFVFIEK